MAIAIVVAPCQVEGPGNRHGNRRAVGEPAGTVVEVGVKPTAIVAQPAQGDQVEVAVAIDIHGHANRSGLVSDPGWSLPR